MWQRMSFTFLQFFLVYAGVSTLLSLENCAEFRCLSQNRSIYSKNIAITNFFSTIFFVYLEIWRMVCRVNLYRIFLSRTFVTKIKFFFSDYFTDCLNNLKITGQVTTQLKIGDVHPDTKLVSKKLSDLTLIFEV